MKVLNLDKIADERDRREIHLGGKTYVVEPISVDNYIETTLAAEALGDDATAVQQIEATVKMIQRSVPTIEERLLRRLSLEQLRVLVAFVRGEDNDAEEAQAAQAAEGDEGK